MVGKSHRAVIRQVAEEYGLYQGFVESRSPVHDERRKTTLLHALAGKAPEPTGRVLCDTCECRLSDPVCESFGDSLRRNIWNILREYNEAFCPACGEQYAGRNPVEVVESIPVAVSGTPELPLESPESRRMMEYDECGCRFELGAEELLWALDRDELNRDASNGEFYGWNGDAAKDSSEIEEAVSDYARLQ